MVKSRSVRAAPATTPSACEASSRKRKPELSDRAAVAYTSALCASKRGVSSRASLHGLSWPSRATVLTAKQRDTPFTRLPARNPSDAVVPSSTQLDVQTPRLPSYVVEYTR